jgi:hypothetical protein
MFGIVPVLFSANVDGVVLLLSETVAGLRWHIDLVDRGVRGLDICTGMSVVVDSVVFLFFFDFEDQWSVTLGPSLITTSKQSSKSRGPLTFYKWNEAFYICKVIYSERFPPEAPNMLKYMSIVKDAYEMRGRITSMTDHVLDGICH